LEKEPSAAFTQGREAARKLKERIEQFIRQSGKTEPDVSQTVWFFVFKSPTKRIVN
jgi:hypothetical protein